MMVITLIYYINTKVASQDVYSERAGSSRLHPLHTAYLPLR